MIKFLFVLVATLQLGWAYDLPQTTLPNIRIAVERTSGLAEVVPELESGELLPGQRGCLSGGVDCPESERIGGAVASVQPGETVHLGVQGEGVATHISVVFRGEEIVSHRDVKLPGTFLIPATGLEGRLHMSVEVDGKVTERSILIGEVITKPGLVRSALGAAAIHFFVNVAEEGIWEVITGSGTGGRLVSTQPYCMVLVPLQLCPSQYRVLGYTDRARRGEQVWTLVYEYGVATNVGVIISGRVRGQWFNVSLPFLYPQTVSLDPNADNVYAFFVLNNSYSERRLPIGTRPF